MMKHTLTLSRATALAACASIILSIGCSDATWKGPLHPKVDALEAVYPYNGQSDAARSTKVFVIFSEPIDAASLAFTLTAGGVPMAGALDVSANGQRATFTPAQPLLPEKACTVAVSGVKTQKGAPVNLPSDGIVSAFTTGAWKVRAGDGLKVTSVDPPSGDFYDFSTLRAVFSEPVDPASVVAGESFMFWRVSTQEQVAGTLLVRGSRLVFDPDGDLVPGEYYLILFTDKITGENGEALTPMAAVAIPKPTTPRTNLTLKFSPDPTDVGGDPLKLPTSLFAGIPINSNGIQSRVIGSQSTYISGTLKIVLADVLTHADTTPFIVPKGQTMRASAMAIKLGGQIDTLLRTGDITMTLLSDAKGIISGNPYKAFNKKAPAAVYQTLDVCITAADPTVNSLLNQDLMNLQLYGESTTEGDDMVINFVGTTELGVMGAEKAPVTIALRLVTTWEDNMPSRDTIPPVVSSIYPSNGEDNVEVNSSVVVAFSKPVKESSLPGRIRLSKGPTDVPGSIRVDGSSAIFTPNSLLTQASTFTISVDTGIEDLSGNTLVSGTTSTMTTEPMNPGSPKAPLVSSINPGVGCVLTDATSGNIGRCTLNDQDEFGDPMSFSTFVLPSNQDIVVYFTKPISATTVTETSLSVTDTTTGTPVPGSRIVKYKKVTFVPNDPWIEGREYRLMLVGGPVTTCISGDICGTEGLPLNTDILNDITAGLTITESPGGGTADRAAITVPFIGGAFSPDVGMELFLLRSTDSNSNGITDTIVPAETRYVENSTALTPTPVVTISDKIYMSGTMLSTIKQFDPSNNMVPLETLPGNWMYGTNIVLAGGLPTGRNIIRPTGTAGGGITSPAAGDPDQRPGITLTTSVWMNVVNDLSDFFLQKTPITMDLSGRINFLRDGRMEAKLTNAQSFSVNATLFYLIVKPGDLNVRTLSPPVKQ